jgi:hypothetical protein
MHSAHMPLFVLSNERTARVKALVLHQALAFLVGPRAILSVSTSTKILQTCCGGGTYVTLASNP